MVSGFLFFEITGRGVHMMAGEIGDRQDPGPKVRYGWTDHVAGQGVREISGVRFWRTGHWSEDVTLEAKVFPFDAILPFLLVSHRLFAKSVKSSSSSTTSQKKPQSMQPCIFLA